MPSQFGEEAIITTVFPLDVTHGYAVDVGASDGVFLSNTLALEERGWDVLCIEPNPLWECEKKRKRVLTVACGAENLDEQDFTVVTMGEAQGYWSACSALNPNPEVMEKHAYLTEKVDTIKVPVRTLDWCLAEVGFPRLDFLTIDTEGHDIEVLKGFDVERWVPKLMIIENWSGDDRFVDYLKPFGYVRDARLGVNDIFIRR